MKTGHSVFALQDSLDVVFSSCSFLRKQVVVEHIDRHTAVALLVGCVTLLHRSDKSGHHPCGHAGVGQEPSPKDILKLTGRKTTGVGATKPSC